MITSGPREGTQRVNPAGHTRLLAWFAGAPGRLARRISTRLTRRGTMFLLIGGAAGAGAALVSSPDLFFIASALMLAPIAAALYVSLRPAHVEVVRHFRPAIVPVGTESVVSLSVRNLSATPLGGAWWNDQPAPGIDAPAAAILSVLGRNGSGADSAHLEYRVTARHRGVYGLGPLRVSRYDPFVLAYSSRSFGSPHDLIVTPRVTALPGGGITQSRNDGSIRELLRQATPTSDELIAREYRPGDPLRRVNWPATARHGQLMVRQEEQRSNPEARLILDTTLAGASDFPFAHISPRLVTAFELEIELAASLGVHLLGAGYRLEIVELGASQLLPGREQNSGGLHGDIPALYRAPGGEHTLLEALASVVPAPQRRSAHAAASAKPARVALHGAPAALPTFALLVNISEADVDDLVAVAAYARPAVACVQRTVSAAARERLSEAGWRCLSVSAISELEDAWRLSGSPGTDDD